ncbi:hypothetical protein RB195_002709 [Necator americanus]|uniref:Uncharacterized protein n=1 Tax=Necator americanus TaxID=51031 RepID=A0ABR1DKA9_NECAM
MNTFKVSAILLALIAAASAKSIVVRQAGDNAYGDEPAVATSAPYGGEAAEETTIIPTEEEPQPVENENAPAEGGVVDSGYRSKREAGDNSYGDEPAPVTPAYEEAEVTTFEPAPEEEAASVPSEPVASEPAVEESGYRA